MMLENVDPNKTVVVTVNYKDSSLPVSVLVYADSLVENIDHLANEDSEWLLLVGPDASLVVASNFVKSIAIDYNA